MKKYERESDDSLTKEEIDELKDALEEVKQCKTKSIEQVAKELDISL